MSKEELKKWHYKYWLWHKLHPRQSFERCRSCKYFHDWYTKNEMKCPRHILIDRRGERHLIELDTMTQPLLSGDICIEWIKNA